MAGLDISPRELGLNFDSWRSGQLDTVERIVNSKKRFIFLIAPTGTGKSMIAVASIRLWQYLHGGFNLDREDKRYNNPNRGYIIVSTKQLQEQYLADFPFIKIVKGRNNFECIRDDIIERYTADRAPCVTNSGFYCEYAFHSPKQSDRLEKACYSHRSGEKWWSSYIRCPYYIQKADALNSNIVLFNYPYYILQTNYVGDFQEPYFVFFDEAHSAESQLISFLDVVLTKNRLGNEFPSKQPSSYIDWLDVIIQILESKLKSLKELKPTRRDEVREIAWLENNIPRLRVVLESCRMDPDNWLCEYYRDRIVFRPIWVGQYGYRLYRYGRRIVFMSATLEPDMHARILGINPSDIEVIRLPEVFPREHRVLRLAPIIPMSHRNREWSMPKMVKFVDSIITKDNLLQYKGLIHTNSYSLMKFFKEHSVYRQYMMVHDTNSRIDVLQRFYDSTPPSILVSPSMTTGIDFHGDRARWSIIVKIPFPDYSDKRTYIRLKQSREWYLFETAMTLVQTLGRGVRSMDDWCINYILDANYNRIEDIVGKFNLSMKIEKIKLYS